MSSKDNYHLWILGIVAVVGVFSLFIGWKGNTVGQASGMNEAWCKVQEVACQKARDNYFDTVIMGCRKNADVWRSQQMAEVEKEQYPPARDYQRKEIESGYKEIWDACYEDNKGPWWAMDCEANYRKCVGSDDSELTVPVSEGPPPAPSGGPLQVQQGPPPSPGDSSPSPGEQSETAAAAGG